MVTEAKKNKVDELHKEFNEAKVALFANFSGITVEEVTGLRNGLRPSDARLKVIKNTLARRAIEGTPLADAKDYLSGPVTVALGYGDDIGAPAKALLDFSKKNEGKLTILGGVVEGSLVDASGVKALADLPPKPVVQSMLLGLMQAPAKNFMGLMQNSARQMLYLLNGLAEKKKEEGGGA